MMQTLYHEVYGDRGRPATEEELKELGLALGRLPAFLGGVLLRHYVWKRSMEEISAETGDPIALQERWRMS